MAPKKVTGEPSASVSSEEKEVITAQETESFEDANKAMKKVPSHPPTLEMVKEAVKELDQRKGVSAQAIRTFIKGKYVTVDETRLKTLLRKALVKGLDSGVLVRPPNTTMTSGAHGRFRLGVKTLKPVKSKENMNPNISKAKDDKAETDVKTKKTKAAVEVNQPKDNPKKTQKNGAQASKVAPAKKPKAKRAVVAQHIEQEPNASRTENGEKSSGKKGGKKAARKVDDGGEQSSSRSRKKAEKPAEK